MHYLQTAHHRTTFGIFCNFTQKTIPRECSYKMFHISSMIVLFLMGRSMMFFGNKDKSSSGEGKRNWVRGGIEEKPK